MRNSSNLFHFDTVFTFILTCHANLTLFFVAEEEGDEQLGSENTKNKRKRKAADISTETPIRRSERIKAAMANYIEVFTNEPVIIELQEDL